MQIETIAVPVTTTGSAGSATGSAATGLILGWLLDVYLDYHASTPATADVTISHTGRGGNILVVTNSATDGLYAPRQPVHDAAAAAISGVVDRVLISTGITVAIAGADALTNAVVAYLRILRP